MSLIGYCDLATLRSRLLPADLGEDAEWDADISAIGLGVAGIFDAITGRELRRNTAARFECPADVDSVVLKSYPVESITSVMLASGTGPSADVSSAVLGLQKASGIVDFGGVLGSHVDRLEIVSSGGFWCDASDDVPMPSGATPMPGALLEAFFLQCRAMADAQGTFRQKGAGNFSDKDKREPSLRMDTLDVIPSVKRTLQLFMRMP